MGLLLAEWAPRAPSVTRRHRQVRDARTSQVLQVHKSKGERVVQRKAVIETVGAQAWGPSFQVGSGTWSACLWSRIRSGNLRRKGLPQAVSRVLPFAYRPETPGSSWGLSPHREDGIG